MTITESTGDQGDKVLGGGGGAGGTRALVVVESPAGQCRQ